MLCKKVLREEEKELFFKSAQIAVDMAKNDENAPPDVENILMQQKELPDGSGFPKGIDYKQITPLSALFIVSHDLVDFMIENKNWSLYSYIKNRRKKFRGGFFLKIFQCLETLRFSR